MAALLITFRLAKPTTDPNYLAVIAVLKQYPFTLLREGSVAIETGETPSQVFNKFKPSVLQWMDLHAKSSGSSE